MGRVLLVHLVLRTGLRSLQCRIQTGNGLLQYKGGGPPRLRLKGGREDAKTVQLHHGGACGLALLGVMPCSKMAR